ncbi:uncharacterized protein BJX67DRAFT_39732 [Aspergillus lucknowensis]|uniref:Uncharacterized protein n=1 Tax=Aspergillus lucknowensis TaxID=176173 RepID=A0ABR4LWD5_9EURO
MTSGGRSLMEQEQAKCGVRQVFLERRLPCFNFSLTNARFNILLPRETGLNSVNNGLALQLDFKLQISQRQVGLDQSEVQSTTHRGKPGLTIRRYFGTALHGGPCTPSRSVPPVPHSAPKKWVVSCSFRQTILRQQNRRSTEKEEKMCGDDEKVLRPFCPIYICLSKRNLSSECGQIGVRERCKQ